jgi:hypothetical protein
MLSSASSSACCVDQGHIKTSPMQEIARVAQPDTGHKTIWVHVPVSRSFAVRRTVLCATSVPTAIKAYETLVAMTSSEATKTAEIVYCFVFRCSDNLMIRNLQMHSSAKQKHTL